MFLPVLASSLGLVPEAGPDVNSSLIDALVGDYPWVPYAFWGLAAFLALTALAKTWVGSPAAPTGRRIIWTVFLLIPYIGWVFWMAFFKMPRRHGIYQPRWRGPS